jgi:hypothetical protein
LLQLLLPLLAYWGVIGQAVSGLAKLQKFFDEYERAPHLVKKLKGDISGLETTLLEVKEVVQLFQKAENADSSEILQTSTASLDKQVKLCSDDIKLRVKETEDLNPKLKSGLKTFFTRLKAAMSGAERFQAFASDVIKHRQSIGNSFALLMV